MTAEISCSATPEKKMAILTPYVSFIGSTSVTFIALPEYR
jgi:hypothetical protein